MPIRRRPFLSQVRSSECDATLGSTRNPPARSMFSNGNRQAIPTSRELRKISASPRVGGVSLSKGSVEKMKVSRAEFQRLLGGRDASRRALTPVSPAGAPMRSLRGRAAKFRCFPGLSGHFGEVQDGAGGDSRHVSERSRAEEMKCPGVLGKHAGVL